MTDADMRAELLALFSKTDALMLRVEAEGNAGAGGKERQRLLESVANHLWHARQRVCDGLADVLMKEKVNASQ